MANVLEIIAHRCKSNGCVSNLVFMCFGSVNISCNWKQNLRCRILFVWFVCVSRQPQT